MREKQKPKKETLEIKGLMDNNKIRWKKIPCKCSQDPNDVEHQFPIQDCIHCKFLTQENSMPRKPFTATDGKNKNRLVTKIEIMRGKKYDDIIGWVF